MTTRDALGAAYWRNAYEELVKQTGRDLNDGYGIDPRKARDRQTGHTTERSDRTREEPQIFTNPNTRANDRTREGEHG